MPRSRSSRPTDVELQILNVLWDHGAAPVRKIHDLLAPERNTGLSTTLKMVQVMHEKGLLTRDDKVRPQLYQAACSREATQLHILGDLTRRAFGGSASQLVMRMISSDMVSDEELAEMQQLIENAKKEDRS